jgi:hypothetical protein
MNADKHIRLGRQRNLGGYGFGVSAQPNGNPPYKLRAWRSDLIALAVLLLLDLILLWPGLLPGKVLMPLDVLTLFRPWRHMELPAPLHNPLPTDVVDIIYPTRHFAAESLRQGQFPLWNPYTFSGYSFVGNFQAGLFYPINLFFYLLPASLTAVANDLDLILHLFLAGAGMYFYMRTIDCSPLASLGAGIVFMLNGIFVVWLEWHTILSTGVWLPFVWAFFEMALRRRRWLYFLLAAVALTLLLVGGHPQWMMYGVLALGLYFVFRIAWPSPATRRWTLMGAVLLTALGFALAAIQLVPAIEYLILGHRSTLPYSEVIRHGMWPRLVVYLLPDFFSNPTRGGFWGPENFAESTVYVGILPLLLSMTALLVRRDRFTLFFTAMCLFALLLAAGTPLYYLVYPLPGFSGLRVDRLIYLANLSLSALTGLAIEGMARTARVKRPFVGRNGIPPYAIGMCALLLICIAAGYSWHYRAELSARWDDPRMQVYYQIAVFAFFVLLSSGVLILRWAGRISSRAFPVVALVVIAGDLLRFGMGYNTVSPVSLMYPPTETVRFLQADPEPYRIVTLRRSHALRANTGLVPSIADAAGYNYAAPKRYVELMNAANGAPVMWMKRHILLEDYRSSLLDLLNVSAELWVPADVPDVAQLSTGGTVSIEPDRSYEQALVMQEAGLHRVDVWLAEGQPATGTLRLSLYTDRGPEPVAHATVELAQATDEPLKFYFSALSNRLGRHFRFRIEAETPETKASLQASDTGDLRFASYYAPYDGLVFESLAEDTRVYLNDGYLPRVFVTHRVEMVPDPPAVLARLSDPNFDRRGTVILEEAPPPEHRLPEDVPTGDGDVAEVVAYRLNRVSIRTHTSSPGYLVLADSHYPGWRATVDGQKTRIYRADYVLRAVYLPPGDHEVLFSFWPTSFILGGLISTIALAALVTLLAIDIARARKER